MATPKQTARALLRANRKFGVSWRVISKQGHIADGITILPGVAHGTLCRFAKSKGLWLPKDIETLKLLGLHHEKQPRPKMISDMSADELLKALNNRTALIANHSKRAMAEFIHACHVTSRARRVAA